MSRTGKVAFWASIGLMLGHFLLGTSFPLPPNQKPAIRREGMYQGEEHRPEQVFRMPPRGSGYAQVATATSYFPL